jgi:hypothetical protein
LSELLLWRNDIVIDRCILAALAVTGATLASVAAGERIADDRLAGWTDARVKNWQPKAKERRIDEVGWAKDIRTARELSRKHERPVFLFTMDGRMTIGRC